MHDVWLAELKNKAEDRFQTLNLQERDQLKLVLNNSLNRLDSSLRDLNLNQLYFKPSEKKWSIAECVAHITAAELEFPKILELSLKIPSKPNERKQIKIKDEDIQKRIRSRRWKAKRPEKYKPQKLDSDLNFILDTFRNQRNKTINYVETTNDDLRNHFWKHPLTGKIDLFQTLLLMSAHLERHIDQIELIKLNKNFPKN